MEIKGISFESGKKPVICIPVMGTNQQQVLTEAKRVIDAGAKMIEWRVDYLEADDQEKEVEEILEKLQSLCENTVLLVTLRTKEQGGLAEIEEPQLSQFYLNLAKMEKADMIDVEFFGVDTPERLIGQMKEHHVCVITSHHDFGCTPEETVMYMLFEKMAEGGADIVKLATMPQSLQDVLDVLRVTCQFSQEYPEIPVASMSMGGKGIISRVCGEVFGSCMTFGTMGSSSAPGQMPAEELEQILSILHKNFER